MTSDWRTFSEDSAMKYLYRILGDQARVSGSVYHFVKTRDLKWLLEEVTANSNLPVHIDWQYVSGNYWLEFDPPYVNSYNNVSNIIAILEGESGVKEDSIGTSLLVNCHYDSVPFAIGASDNGIFCAAMVEILVKLSRRKEKFKQNIIFLFNGAEENVLMGSHGFLKHPWSKNISSVINLDSAGMNGRPSVFQVTNPQILPHYSKTPRPTAQAVGQFLFQSGIIPSDTDFRIWRDFGNITGLDIAFTESGHVYHTRYDKPQMIQTGVIQHAGDMLITLIAGVAERRQGDEQDNSSPVYYDYLSLFLISYSERQSQIIDGVVAVLGLMSVVYYMWLFGLRWSVLRDLLCSLAGRLVCIVAGVLTVALLTLATILLDMGVARYMQLRYLSYKWLVVPFYWLPYFTSYILVSFLYDGHCNNKVNRSIKSLQAMTATRLLLSMLLLISVALPSLSKVRYVLTVIVLMTSLCSFITMTCVRRFRLTGVQHLLLQVFLSVPLSLFCFSLSLRLSPFLSSILGRSGSNYPDIMMAGASAGLAVVFGFGVSGIELLFSKSYMSRVLCSLLCVWLVLSLVPITQYGGEVTQRHYWFHTKITTYNSSLAPIDVNSGVVIMKLDPYTVQSALKAIKESPFYSENEQTNETFIKGIKIIDEECNDLVNCNLPSIRPRRNSLFLKMDPPREFNRSFNLVNKYCDETKCHMSFIMRGAAHNAITLYPYFNITAWSLEPEVKSTTTFKDRPLYVIYHACNTYVEFFEPFEFNITMEVG
ncbi:unnamed protein product [Danaus chrysippus]|uniref:FXNA-like protease n=1 Tax=Danaus chrysippus TaxID=151541 RepID=A0A8J2W416_9NEOP|nr:unnamed protein product [Danaus chrysippus]